MEWYMILMILLGIGLYLLGILMLWYSLILIGLHVNIFIMLLFITALFMLCSGARMKIEVGWR